MYTLNHYQAMGHEVRSFMLQGKPVPPEYQSVIEEFMPTEEKYPERRVITIFEYPDSDPDQFLENKRGFRLQFMLLFLSNECAANFYKDVQNNKSLKWQIARQYLEVVDNMVFIKTRGNKLSNMLEKIQDSVQTHPLFIFHYKLKMRVVFKHNQTLLKIIEDGNWSLRVVWGPPIDIPLYGGDIEKQENIESKLEPKLEIKFRKEEIEQKNPQIKLQQDEIIEEIYVKPTEYYIRLAEEISIKLIQQNQKK